MVLADIIRVRPLSMILFLLLSELSSVLTNVTGRSYVTCSRLTVSASDVVRHVCFLVLCSLSSFWFLPRCGRFLSGPALSAQVWLDSYSEGDLPPCCEAAWLQALCDGPLFPSSGPFSSLFDAMVSDRSNLSSWYDLLDPVFASLLWSRWFPPTYILFYYLTGDYLAITGGMISRCRVLTFTALVTLLLWLNVLRLSHFHHHSLLLSVPQCARVLPVWERTVFRRLPFRDWQFNYVSELL